MKKSSPLSAKITPAQRAIVRPARGGRVVISTADAAATGTRLEAVQSRALAVAESSPPRDPNALRRVRFGYFQPDAREVSVVGSFNGWDTRATPLRRDSLGDWSIEIDLPVGEHHYRFFVDGAWCDDPAAQLTAMNPFGGFDAIVTVV